MSLPREMPFRPRKEILKGRADWKGYSVAILTCVAALILRALLDRSLQDGYPFIFAFAAVAASAAYGGWRVGLVATILNYLAVDWFFIPPRSGFAFLGTSGGAWPMISFFITSLVITWLAHTMRRADRQARAAAALRDAERERLQVTLRSIGDAVIATDENGAVTFLNPVAERLTGWSDADAKGRQLKEIFNIINETSRQPVANPVEKALKTGHVVGLANHTILIARDGSERAIADSAAPIQTRDGRVTGVVLVFRDVTEDRTEELVQQRKSREQNVLTGSLERLLSSRDPAHLVSELCRQVTEEINADVFIHFRTSEAGDSLILEGNEGVPQEVLASIRELKFGQAASSPAGTRPDSVVAGEEARAKGAEAEFVRRAGLHAYLWVPLTTGDHLLGILCFGSYAREAFTDHETEFVRFISRHVALALDRLHHEQALKAREHRLAEQARLLDLTNDGIIVCDWNDRILYWNRGAEDIYGWSAAEAVGQTKHELLHTQSAIPRAEIIRKLERDNRWQGELSHTCRDGRRIVVITRWALDRDPDGRPAVVLKSDNDITARKEAEEKLRASQRQLRLVADHIPALVGYIDRDLRYRFMNAAYFEWFGGDPHDLVGRRASEVIDPEIYAHRLPFMEAALRGEEVRFDGPAHHRTRGRRHTEVVYIPERSNGEVNGFYVFVQDVSDRIRAQQVLEQQARELREAAQRKDEFLAMLAHELRNPLASASSAAALLNATHEPESHQWAIDVINRQIIHLSRLIDDLLDVSRITSGKIRLQKEVVDTGAVLHRAAESASSVIKERGHKLVYDFPQEPWALPMEADPTRLDQIVSNLLTNAAKYTEAGGTIWLSARPEFESTGERMVVITVRDTGMGIPPDRIDSMFELFAQGERSIARSEGGLGIGLTLVKKLTEMHGGTVVAHSEGVGKGSEFVVRIPAGEVIRKAAARDGVSPSAHQTEQPGAAVLIVDDNHDTATGMARLLKIWNYRAVAVHNGNDALVEAARIAPHFVLLDIGLPGIDGYEVCRQLRQLSCCDDALIIAISGYGQDEDKRRSLEAGFDHHLTKPVNLDELRALLSSANSSSKQAVN